MNTNQLIEKVEVKLQEAYTLAKSNKFSSRIHPTIEVILASSCKTYKYILVTALAAKAADKNLNPLCLQSSADIEGVYNAREVCHECIVPFERSYLNNQLGGSNEPFLNKPARFTVLSKNNPTKQGEYKKCRDQLIDFLSCVNSSKKSFDFLTQTISCILATIIKQKSLPFSFSSSTSSNHVKVYNITTSLLKKNNGGEILTLIAASLYEIYLHEIYDEYRVDVHNVNQSGSSSRQISDIDLYLCGDLFLCNEIKDKAFSVSDVEHAVNKAKEANCKKLNFIYGAHVTPNGDEINSYQEQELKQDFLLNVISIKDFLSTILSLTSNVDARLFADSLVSIAKKNNYSQNTSAYLAEVLARYSKCSSTSSSLNRPIN